MRGFRQFCQGGPTITTSFFVHEGRKNPILLYAGQSWHNIECWLCSFVIFQGIQTNIAKNPYFCEFSSVTSSYIFLEDISCLQICVGNQNH